MKKRTIATVVFAILLVGWMTLIFSFSCEDGDKSANTSTDVVTEIVEIISPTTPAEKAEQIVQENQTTIRKLAHFALYMGLGFFACGLSVSAFDISTKSKFLLTFSFCIFYAATDELHQFFVVGRSGSAVDVALDSFGALVTIIAVLSAEKLYLKMQSKKSLIC